MPHILGIPHPKQPIVGGLAGKAVDFLASKVKQQTQLVPQKAQQPFRPTYQQATQVAQNIRPSVPVPQTPRPFVGGFVGKAVQNVKQAFTNPNQFFTQVNQNIGLIPKPTDTITYKKFGGGFIPTSSQQLERTTNFVLGFQGGNVQGIAKNFVRNPKLEPAVKLLQNRITKEDVDVLGQFAAQVQKNPKAKLGQLGKTMQAFAEQTFGPQAVTWNNKTLAKAIDYTLERIGQGKNPAGLGLSTVDVSKGLAKPGAKNLIQTGNETITPVQKIIDALTKAKPLRGQQETIYSAERGARFAKSQTVREGIGGEAGAIAGRKQLTGEIPKVQFESIRPQLTQPDIDSLFNQVSNHSTLMEGQKTNAFEGLSKLLGERGGGVPTESQIKLLDTVFGQDFSKTIMKNRPMWDKILANAGDAINLPRAITASLDLSAPLRQGLPLITRGEFWKSLPGMVKSLVSEKSFKAIQEGIQSHPLYGAMQDAGLALTDIGGLGLQEEAFLTKFAGKIPGIRASNRAYVGFLNKLRADTFASLAKGLEKEGRLNPDSLKSVADFVNTATGRGNFSLKVGGGAGVLNQAQGLLNATFFSPRLIASRLQLLNPQFYAKQDPYVRKEAIKSILGATTAVMTVLGLAKLAGADVGTDPRSADFAKAKVGNTRYDVTGGFGAYFRLVAQLKTGQLINSTTGRLTTLGEGYKPLTPLDIMARFAQNKYSPVVSLVSTLLQGKNAVGETPDFTETNPFKNPLGKLLIPMIAQDFAEAYEETGDVGKSALLSTPGIFGVGQQTYGYNLPDKLKAETEGMSREERNAFRDQALEVAKAKVEGQEVTDQKTQAMDYFEKRMEGMNIQAKQGFIKQVATSNPAFAKELMQKVKENYKNEQKGLTPIDKELKNSSTITRAKYIRAKVQSLSDEQAKLFWLEMKEKGILTKEVYQQLR